MATLNKGLITQAGLDLFNKVEAGNAQITYTKVVFSSNTDILNMQDTDVRQLNDVQPQEIKGTPQAYDNGTVTGENNIKAAEVDIRCVVDNENLTKGFKPYTTALYASDGNKEILYGLYLRDDPGYLPPFDGLTRQPLMFTWRLFTATTDNFNLDDKSDIYATLADLQGVDNKVDTIQEATDKLSAQIDAKIKDLSNSLQNQINNAIAQDKASMSDFLNKYSGNIDKLNLVVTKLKGNPPTKPTLSASMDTQKGQISYKITPPSSNGGSNVYQYQIFYKSVNDNDYQETDQPGNIIDGTIYNLNGKIKYNLYVVAQNAAGASPKSDVLTTDIIDGRIFGVTSNNISDPQLTRTDAAQGMVAGINGDRNDFDNAGIWKQMHRVTDNNGNVFVRIPKFYIYKNINGNALTIKVSLAKISNDWYLPKCFWDFQDNKELPYVDVGAYDASDNGSGGLASTTGSAPLVNTNLNDFRTKARNDGAGYQLLDIHVVDALQALFTVEFATLNSQSVMEGNDNSGGLVNNGNTDNKVGSSNTNGSGSVAMNYRGIENLYGNIFQWVDGISENGSQLFVCDDPSNYQSSVFANPYQQVGYSQPNGAGGWISQMGYDPNHPEVTTPVAFNGSGSSYYCDYGDVGGSGDDAFYIGGYWYNTSNDGLFYWLDSTSTGTSGSIGSRLVRKA